VRHCDNALVRMRQDGGVVAVRRGRLGANKALGNGRLNGIATSLDGGKIWITVTGHLAGITNAMGGRVGAARLSVAVRGRRPSPAARNGCREKRRCPANRGKCNT